ncbi:isoaspartyl peptidase/L-asparaginase [Leekyejoonella antrihumi]|uniref:Isoaspartyl peptidase/L-asparaginase n=1 Tax=Leekyejoonella antrihumi TaxID=1660198 RepID=A0A563DUI5_9MICO|nr:isoaspartyl peptidase/L-asparaginase [Leekyejoonella antrihumi]
MYSRNAPRNRPGGPLLLIHGGAGPRATELALQASQHYEKGLADAIEAGRAALLEGESALDAVCAAVVALEDNPLFNAGRGASLTDCGTAEMDAAVMTGDGHAGAVAASRFMRNPVVAARAVMEQTDHVLVVDPGIDLADRWGMQREPTEYFITAHRMRQLEEVLAHRQSAPRCGTVGAVAMDLAGSIACATSTGGMVGQAVGRVGDTGLIGAGSFASEHSAAISCTGEGEAFIQGVVAHDIAARMRYGGSDLTVALRDTYQQELNRRGATGGTIALTPSGQALIAHNSKAMFAGYWDGDQAETFV